MNVDEIETTAWADLGEFIALFVISIAMLVLTAAACLACVTGIIWRTVKTLCSRSET